MSEPSSAAATTLAGEGSAVRVRALVREMRTPITPVKLQIEMLLSAPLPPDQRRSVELLARNCERLVGLLGELEREAGNLPA